MFKCGKDGFANIVDRGNNFSVPKAQNGKTQGQHVPVALGITWIFKMLATVGFDNKHGLPASKISKIGAKRVLASEFVAAEATAF